MVTVKSTGCRGGGGRFIRAWLGSWTSGRACASQNDAICSMVRFRSALRRALSNRRDLQVRIGPVSEAPIEGKLVARHYLGCESAARRRGGAPLDLGWARARPR